LNSETVRSHVSAPSFHVTVATKHVNSLRQGQRVTKCPYILCNPHYATCHFPEPYEFSIRDIILFISNIIASSRLCLCLPHGPFPSDLPVNVLYLFYHPREPRTSLGSTNHGAPHYLIHCVLLLPPSSHAQTLSTYVFPLDFFSCNLTTRHVRGLG
jgi:hypothetical protein